MRKCHVRFGGGPGEKAVMTSLAVDPTSSLAAAVGAAHRQRWALRVTAMQSFIDSQLTRWLPCRQGMCDRPLARRRPVEVHVGIETQGPPTRARLDVLRRAAARFTDNKASICVTHELMPDRHCLITQFTMRTTAQYKVIDEIATGFKMAIWDFGDYMDMWITFPKPKTKPRRRSRKLRSDAAGGL